MAFRFVKERIVRWPVSVSVPVDGGDVEAATFTVIFKMLGDEEGQALAMKGDQQLLRKVVIGWDELLGGDGAPLPFSVEALEQLLDHVPVCRGMAAAYLEATIGAQSKNWKRPLPNGQSPADQRPS